MTTDRLWVALIAAAITALVYGWLVSTSVDLDAINPEFTCSPGSTYTTKECP